MKNKRFFVGIISILLIIGFSVIGCSAGDDSGNNNGDSNNSGENNNGGKDNGGDIAVTFSGVTADGSATQTTTQLTLTFSQAITGLTANDITLSGVSGVSKGAISGSGPSYTLPISGFTVSGALSVTVSKTGYAITGSPKTTPVYYYDSNAIAVTLDDVFGDGSVTETTTQIFLEFSEEITGLSANDIILSGVNGVNKGSFSKDNKQPLYTLDISGFTSGGTLSVAVVKSGYTISGSPKTVTIYYSGGGDTDVTFSNVTANGSSSQTTTELTLTFNQAIADLSADDISLSGVSGVSKGTLSGSGPVYTLPISGFTSGGTLSVAVAKSGYTISGSPKTVTINYNAISDGSEENPFPLTEGIWKDGNITAGTSAVWYSFNITSGTAYNVWVNQRDGGDGTKTLDTTLDVSYADGTSIVWRSFANTRSPASFTADRDGIVKLKIYPYVSNGTGTYAIGYSVSNTNVTLNDITANGSATESTTLLTLTFDKAILLNTSNIGMSIVSGITGNNIRFSLSGSGNTYTLGISGFFGNGTFSIAITPKSGYTISNSPKTVNVFYNGVTWTRMDSPGYSSPNAIAYGNGRFVAVGQGSEAAYSTNGINWTRVTMSNVLTYSHVGIACGTNRFVAVSPSGTMAASADGTSWSYMTGTMTTFGTTQINSIAYGAGKFVAVGNSGKVAFATDSVAMGEWISVVHSTFVNSNIYDVAYGGSRFVAVGQGGNAAYSSDGNNWTAVSDMKFGTSAIYGITYGNGKFVAVGQSGKAAYSSDGITWSAISDMTFGTSGIMNIAYGGGKFVAVGEGGKASYSSDGITWTTVDYPAAGTGTINDIAYGNGKFVSTSETSMAYWVTP